MSARSPIQMNSNLPQSSAAIQTGVLKRASDTYTSFGERVEGKNNNGLLQRKSSTESKEPKAPQIVHEVLNSPGQPLDADTRSFFETRFAHNFSNVPISSTSQQLYPSSLTVGEPADAHEQEADRIADSVMLKTNDQDKTLPANEQPSFGLSQVRVHTDGRAAASAQAINAQAYTVGNHIVFGTGLFAPTTPSGRGLLAHELTHITQQSGSAGTIRRKVNYLKPDIVETDPVTTALDNPNLALTTPKIDGKLLPKPVVRVKDKKNYLDFSGAANIIFPLFGQLYIDRKAGKSMCKVREPEVNVSAQISIMEKPKSKVWQGSAPGTRFKEHSATCESVSNVTVYIKGKSGGDAISVYNKIMANEMEHVDDLNRCSKTHFEPYIEFLNKFNKEISNDQKTEDKECQDAFMAYVGNKDSVMIQKFLEELARLVSIRDKKGGSHDFKPDVRIDDKHCFNVVIKI